MALETNNGPEKQTSEMEANQDTITTSTTTKQVTTQANDLDQAANSDLSSQQINQQNPIDELKKQAKALGLDPEALAIMEKKEFQSKIDSAIAKAIKTREENLKKKAAMEEMKRKGEFEKILKQERSVALRDVRSAYLQAESLPEDLADLIPVTGLESLSLEEAKEELKKRVTTTSTAIKQMVEQKVKEKLAEIEKGTSFAKTTATSAASAPQNLADLSYEEQVKLFHENPALYAKLSQKMG